VDVGAEVSATFTVSNSSESERTGVVLTVWTGAGEITSLTPSTGTCTTGSWSSCDLGTLAPDALVTVEVTAAPSASGIFPLTGQVTSTYGCELDTINDEATAEVTVEVPPDEEGSSSSIAAAGGGCGCRLLPEWSHTERRHGRWAAAGAVGLLVALRRRRRAAW
jgi:hypothetical protein